MFYICICKPIIYSFLFCVCINYCSMCVQELLAQGYCSRRSSMSMPKKAKVSHKGGLRQRLELSSNSAGHGSSFDPPPAAEPAALGPEGFDSGLVLHLLKEWSWGHLSATKMQQIALQSYKDQVLLLKTLRLSEDFAHTTLKKLASLGSFGKFPNNCHTELMCWLGEPSTPAPFMHQVPFVCEKIASGQQDQNVTIDFPIFLPHSLFSHLFHHNKDRFEQLFLGNHATPEKIKAFWATLKGRGDPRLVDHPQAKRPLWDTTTIPLAFHGDAVPVLQVGKSNTKSLEVYSVQSLFNTSSTTLQAKVLMSMVFTSSITDATYEEIWRVLNWSLFWLGEGKWPPVDCYDKPWASGTSEFDLGGTPLAGGYSAIILAIKGDLELLRQQPRTVIPTVWGRGGKNPAFGKDKSKGKSLGFGQDKSKGKSRDMQHSDAVARVARLRRQAGQTQAAPHRMESAWCMVFTDRPTLAGASPEHEALLVTIHLTCVFKIVRAMAREDKFPGPVRRYRRTGHLRRKFSAADIIMIRKTFALIEVSAPVFTPSASRESSLAPSASACSLTPDAAIVVADDTPEAWPAFQWVTQGKTNALLMHVKIIGLFEAGYKHNVLVYGESYN